MTTAATAPEAETKALILDAAKTSLLEHGYAGMSTRKVAATAGVPLSQIHYHFGSKRNMIISVLEKENRRLLDRQARTFESETLLWRQWDEACDYLDEDLARFWRPRCIFDPLQRPAGFDEAPRVAAVAGLVHGFSLDGFSVSGARSWRALPT